MAFYSEKDQKRIGAALTALRSVELRSESLNEVISVLSGENNDDRSVSGGSSDFFDESAVYQCLANLIREVDSMQKKIGNLQIDLTCERLKAERSRKSIDELRSQIDHKQDRRKWWFS